MAGTRPPALLVVPAMASAAVALLPLVYLVVRAGSGGAGRVSEVLLRDRTAQLLVRSLTLALVVTTACLLIGVAAAWVVVRTRLPGRRAWAVLLALPLAVPTYVAAYSWISIRPQLAGFWGAALVLTLCSYPYVYLPVAAALRRTDPAIEEVSRALGAGPWRTFRSVTARQLRPAASAGALLVALYVLSDFGAVSVMRFDAFTRVIYTSYRASFDRTPAAVLGCVLVAVTVVLVVAEARTRGRARYAPVGAGARRPAGALATGSAGGPLAAGLAIVVALAIGVPVASLGYWLSRGTSSAQWPDVVSAAVSTLQVSVLGAAATTLLAVPVGVLAARYRTRVAALTERAAYAGHALPGIVVALSLVFFAVRYAAPVYQRTPVLVTAYVVLFLPLAVGAIRASVAQSPPALEEVARALGRSPASVLRTVTLPLAAPGVAAGAALVFLTCMKELPATLLLHPTGVDTLATGLWTRTGVGQYAAAAPYAAVLVGLAALPTYLLGRHSGALEQTRR